MYLISLSCIIYTYCKLILKSPSGRINKKVLYCIVLYCIAPVRNTDQETNDAREDQE